jgi:hypothetical protein
VGGASILATFLALYRGDSVSAAKLLALSANPQVVRDFAGRLLEETGREQDPDPVLEELEHGRRRVLQLVKSGTE